MTTPPANPPAAIDGLCTPHPITLGQIALLEKIHSPFLGQPKEVQLYDYLPTLFILSLPAKEAVAHLNTLEADAIEWAETKTLADIQQATEAVQKGIDAFYSALPRATDKDGPTKKASPVTD